MNKEGIERQAKVAEEMLDLRDNPLLRPTFDGLRAMVDGINHSLLYKDMTEVQRKVLMEKRNFVEDFLGMFVGAEITLKKAREALEKLSEGL